MRKVELLRQLQMTDRDLESRQERLETVRRQLADRAELEEAGARHEASQRELRGLQGEQVDLELAVDDLRERVKQIDRKLYSGTIHNPKELEGFAREAEQFKRMISSQEDRLLECLEQVEQATASARAAQARLEQAQREWRHRQETLAGESTRIEGEIVQLRAEQAQTRGLLDPHTLRLYDGLRRSRGGLAVVEIRQRTCQGCRISLPANEELRARSSQELVLCQSCGRILYAAS